MSYVTPGREMVCPTFVVWARRGESAMLKWERLLLSTTTSPWTD